MRAHSESISRLPAAPSPDAKALDLATYGERLARAALPADAARRAHDELARLARLPIEAPEYGAIRAYLDWLTAMPWAPVAADAADIAQAARALDAQHFGLKEVKERVLEHLAVRRLNPARRGEVLCFVGPPGVGKSSLARAIARALGRRFVRVSLGGVRDQAEIKGARRVLPGALPGKIVQGMRRAECADPVLLLDEIDKLWLDGRDPSSALLEALDPDQNRAFEDHYLETPIDLSHVVFIANANVAEQIPHALLDRMEVIDFPGYIPEEKRAIAAGYILPRQLAAHGLDGARLRLTRRALDAIIDGYTREAGVRELDRQIARVCRKVAARLVRAPGRPPSPTVGPEQLARYLGPRRFITDVAQRLRRPGVVTGVSWTSTGGEILFVEASRMKGSGRLELTGMLGDVMQESAKIALSYVRSHARRYEIPEEVFGESDLHVHVPAGAVPKDGPSAGVTIAAALVSLLARGRGRRARSRVALTGELTLRGAVLAVGGVKEKVTAARRAGIETIVMPAENRPDLAEIPPYVRRGLTFRFVHDFDEVVRAALHP